MPAYRNSLLDVTIRKLDKIPDERGFVAHMLRVDDPEFEAFGEIYFSTVYPKVIKGWHFHKFMTLNYVCISGMIKLVVLDDNTKEWEEFIIGEQDYCLVHIPPGLWNAFQGLGTTMSIVANCATMSYDKNDILSLPSNEFDDWYSWR